MLVVLIDFIGIFTSRQSIWMFGFLFVLMCYGVGWCIKKYKDIYRKIEGNYKKRRRELKAKFKKLQEDLKLAREPNEKIHYLGLTENSIIADLEVVKLKIYFLDREFKDNIHSHKWERRVLLGSHIFLFILMLCFNINYVSYAAEKIMYQVKQSGSDISADETEPSTELEEELKESEVLPDPSYDQNGSEEDLEVIEWSYNFVLSDSDLSYDLSKELEYDVFGEFEGDEVLRFDIRISTDYLGINKENPEELAYYSNLEKKFLEDSAYAKKATTQAEWYQLAPHSDRLDVIIKGRENVVDEIPIASVYWLLANNYQLYALEYQKQNRDGAPILYYYCKSIQSIRRALENAGNESDIDKMYQYLKMRYLDIANCTKIDFSYRQKAQAILERMY